MNETMKVTVGAPAAAGETTLISSVLSGCVEPRRFILEYEEPVEYVYDDLPPPAAPLP